MNLTQMRDAVRNQLDVDSSELPNAMLDLFLQEAFNQTVALEDRWPSYETEWAIPVAADTPFVALPPDVDGIGSVKVLTPDTRLLSYSSHQFAEQVYPTGEPGWTLYYSVWGGNLHFWPTPDEAITLTVRGRRLPLDWIALGASTEVDCDTRLHLPIVHYACSRVYAQQEDDQLSAFYMQSWSNSVGNIRKSIMRPPYQGIWQMAAGGPL